MRPKGLNTSAVTLRAQRGDHPQSYSQVASPD